MTVPPVFCYEVVVGVQEFSAACVVIEVEFFVVMNERIVLVVHNLLNGTTFVDILRQSEDFISSVSHHFPSTSAPTSAT